MVWGEFLYHTQYTFFYYEYYTVFFRKKPFPNQEHSSPSVHQWIHDLHAEAGAFRVFEENDLIIVLIYTISGKKSVTLPYYNDGHITFLGQNHATQWVVPDVNFVFQLMMM